MCPSPAVLAWLFGDGSPEEALTAVEVPAPAAAPTYPCRAQPVLPSTEMAPVVARYPQANGVLYVEVAPVIEERSYGRFEVGCTYAHGKVQGCASAPVR